MKITANFVEQASRRARLLSLSISFAGGVLLIAAIGLWWQAETLEGKSVTLAKRLAVQEVVASQVTATANELPSSAEMLRMERFAKDTRLLFASSMTFGGFLAKLERALPPDVYLRELAFDQRNAMATMAVESVNEDALTGFFATLEHDQVYRNVKLLKRSRVRIGKLEGGHLQIQLGFVGG